MDTDTTSAEGPAARRYSDLAITRRLMAQAAPYRLHLGAALAASLLAAPLALLQPLPLKVAVDSVIGADPLPGFLAFLSPVDPGEARTGYLVLAAALLIGIAMLGHVQALGNSLLRAYTSEKLVLRFRSRLFGHAQRLSLRYHDRFGTTDALYRIQYDAPAIQWFVIDGMIPFLTAGVTLVGMIYVTATLDLTLAIVALLVSPVLLALTTIIRRRLRASWREVKELEHLALSVLQETLAALRIVKAFGQERHEHQRFVSSHDQSLGARLKVVIVEGGFGVLVGMALAGGTAAVLFVGVTHVQAGSLSLGELLVIMSYIAQLYAPLKTMGSTVATIQNSLASAERAFALLDEAPDVEEAADAIGIDRARGELELRDVSFRYAPDAPLVLRDISFHIRPGKRIGIAGKTGAGKSTLVSLLTRLYDPESGEVRLDGRNIKEYRLDDLRRQFGVVLQETILFSTTIGENIAYARPGASQRQIEEAARAANAHDFIVRLPRSYDTVVGERGMLLSGGERQRIALARAFLKDAPILVLDEPTSSVDVGTESVILEAMERLMRERTTFMIAHRLDTFEGCDFVLLMEDGELVTILEDTGELHSRLAESSVPVSALDRD